MTKKCPICEGDIIDGRCEMCGFLIDGSDIDEGGVVDKEQNKSENNNLSKSKNILQSALLQNDIDQRTISTISATLDKLNVPLILDGSDVSLEEKAEEFVKIAGRCLEKTKASGELCRPEVYIKIGNSFFAMGEEEKAIQYYDRTLQGYPQYKDALYNKGYVLFTQERYEDSLSALEKAISKDDNSPRARSLKELILQLM